MEYEIKQGDCLEVLKTLESESVQMCCTSPPYFGLRDYGTADWTGGDSECEHSPLLESQLKPGSNSQTPASQSVAIRSRQNIDRKTCRKCGAIRVDSQIGLEENPAAYVAKLVEVFEEVRRVLRPDGTLWLNLGDSYAGSWGNYGGQNRGNGTQRAIINGSAVPNPAYDGLESYRPATAAVPGLKPKDLIGIPWRVAFALQEAGWWLRQDIIWAKPNPMPESVTDRCTKAHEYIFLLTKSGKTLLWKHKDGRWVDRKPKPDLRWVNNQTDEIADTEPDNWKSATFATVDENGTPKISKLWSRKNLWRGHDYFYDNEAVKEKAAVSTIGRGPVDFGGAKGRQYQAEIKVTDPNYRNGSEQWGRTYDYAEASATGVNKRSVWTVTTRPFKDAHFATFPPKLIEPCILAGSREGDLVLDPFNGAGTTGLVSLQHRRRYIGIELNPDYIAIAEKRLSELQVNLF